jgi:hypothetical protein
MIIPNTSKSSRIAFDEPTRANATSPMVFITAKGSPKRIEMIS